MMTLNHKVAVGFALIGFFFGWLLTAFFFFPPHSRWNEGLGIGDVATWFSAFGTIAAVVVALCFGLRQILRERDAERQLLHALANTLLVDLWTIRLFLNECQNQWGKAGESISDIDLKNTLARFRWLTLPSFDAYREVLPKLGGGIAPYVIETYGLVLRLNRIANGQVTTQNSRKDDLYFAQMVFDKIPNVYLSIWRAEQVLKPIARVLSLPGEPSQSKGDHYHGDAAPF